MKSSSKAAHVSVYHMLCEALGRELTAQERFAVLALTADPTLLATDPEEHSTTFDAESKPPENWRDRHPTDNEVEAVSILQAGIKGHLVQEILEASKPGTKDNLSASKILLDMWPKVKSDADKHAVFLLCYIIEHSERKDELYPCQQDEWTKITFADYSVPLPDTTNSWVLVFREVFHIPKEMLLLPKVYSPIPNNLLHIINNDTGEELEMIANKPADHVYKPNKLGYTFVAEAITPESLPVGAKWRMRLIGSREPLPQPSHERPSNVFTVKEFRDYYIPSNKHLICRYSVQVTADVLGTVYFQTSHPDVFIHLSILDQEKKVAGETGKGFVIIPVFCFLANTVAASSYRDDKNQKGLSTQDKGIKVVDVPQQIDGKDNTAGKSVPLSDQYHPPTETMGHKYVVQAEVLYKSWDLDESQLAFVHKLRDLEKNELRALSRSSFDASLSPSTQKLINTSFCPKMDFTAFIRRLKDSPVLMDSQLEETRRMKHLEKIQTYSLVREKILECRKQDELNRKELLRYQLNVYENMQAASRQHYQKFLDSCKAFNSRQMAAVEKQALEGAQQAAPEKTTPPSAAPQKPKKGVKSASKKK
ncbi:Androglobin Calpain-7-like protein [Channa argus]|uniref:Androglobin Calpain-7-like protein n=1 Tax=Channa argus TaxID=215402 RepID=A0A6G1QKW1_CHAAH|nr:Androglobin Calpain-7-like protein [Channa argus]